MTFSETDLSRPEAGQGCWTCKKRKIGCDRNLPGCNNCKRTGRQCLGYGIRLVWPDKPDRRRRTQEIPKGNIEYLPLQQPTHENDLKLFLLNVTHEDLVDSPNSLTAGQLVARASHISPPSGPSPNPHIQGGELHLMSYYEQRLSRMISTIDTRNGFRFELLPKAFSPSLLASEALRNAILAVSSFHRSGPASSFKYRAAAVRSLSRSLADGEAQTSSQAANTLLSTSMMLCVNSVFDEKEGHWHCHLQGAQSILGQLTSFSRDNEFLYAWFLYHKVLGDFSRPSEKNYDFAAALFKLMYDRGVVKSMIIGALGCSLEVLEIIHKTNLLRDDMIRSLRGTQTAEEFATRKVQLQIQLLTLRQDIDFRQDVDAPDADVRLDSQRTRIQLTAEFYRLAALLYLRRVSSGLGNAKTTMLYTQQAFNALENLNECTSPWPLFIVACEAETDEQRVAVFRALDQMDKSRSIGNIFVLRILIESFWKQQDLEEDPCRRRHLKWWDTITLEHAGPWFI